MLYTLYVIYSTKFYQDYQMKINEMGGTCSMFRGEERCIQGFGGKT
jgi:hypothetical protein